MLCLSSQGPASAHEIVVFPVDITLKIESDKIRAEIISNAEYWKDNVFHLPRIQNMPALNWPKKMQEAAKETIVQSFSLAMDGVPLSISSLDCRYVEEPFQEESASVHFEVIYPTRNIGKKLSGRAQFFIDEKEASIRENQYEKIKKNFITNLKVSGKKNISLAIPLDKPDFELSIDGMTMTEGQKQLESIRRVLYKIVSSPFFWIALLFASAQIYKRFFKRKEE